jgi:hypothetical protein
VLHDLHSHKREIKTARATLGRVVTPNRNGFTFWVLPTGLPKRRVLETFVISQIENFSSVHPQSTATGIKTE